MDNLSEKALLEETRRIQDEAHEVLIQTGPQHVKDITKRSQERWRDTLGTGNGAATEQSTQTPPRKDKVNDQNAPESPTSYARRTAKVTEKWYVVKTYLSNTVLSKCA